MKIPSGHALVESLIAEGVTKAFCVPGESFLSVLDGFYEHPELQITTMRHEGAASIAAGAWSRLSGEVGVCLASRGPGATNLSIGIHTARQDSIPMVAILGQIPRAHTHLESFQEVDLVSMFSPLAKWAFQIEDPERIPELIHRAIHVARSGRPGPVVISIPEDVSAAAIERRAPRPIQNTRPFPDPASIQTAAENLRTAKRPVIVAGGGVMLPGGYQALIELAETLAAPVYCAWRRFDAFPNDHPLFAGLMSIGMLPDFSQALREADTILAVGCRLSEYSTLDYTIPLPEQHLIQIDVEPSIFGQSTVPHLAIQSDAGAALKALQANLTTFPESPLHAERHAWFRPLRARLAELTVARHFDGPGLVVMEGIFHHLEALLPPDAIITSDAGNFSSWVVRYAKFRQPSTFVGTTAGAMGYAVPSAIAAKMARPQSPVIAMVGDGGFLMTGQEIDTAVRMQVPIITLVFNNSMLATIRMHQERRYPGRTIATDLSLADYAAMARALGAHGERVERNEDVRPALERALAAGRPAVVEFLTRPDQMSANSSR